uniref:40S ribosomal protein S20-like n=1 Tax=Arvicanthis niloticus TaxID=61156 RepID=UPI001486C0EA|nr:40S ribosomal protein S20-like [Arvicanthis niloticus]
MKAFKDTGQTLVEPRTIHQIRIPLTRSNAKSVEVCANFIRDTKEGSVCEAPVHMPKKTLSITTRKTLCVEGSKKWRHFQMDSHKRHLSLCSPSEIVKEATATSIEPGVEAEVTVVDAQVKLV